MARKTAILTTNSQAIADREHLVSMGVAEVAAAERRDNRPTDDRPPTLIGMIREARGIMLEEELLKLCQDAARLELRPPSFTPEDRADCAGELVWQALAERDGCPPRRGEPRATLTYFCGQARNWRKADIARRRADGRKVEEIEDAALLWEVDSLNMAAELDRPMAYRIAAAEQAASELTSRIGLDGRGPVWASLYQLARDCSAEQAAAEQHVSAEAWRKRTLRGNGILRGIFPNSSDLLGFLDPDVSEREPIYRRPKRARIDRTGTAGGEQPPRPADHAEARELSACRHRCPTPGLAAAGESLARRGHYVAAPALPAATTEAGIRRPAGFLWVAGRTALQVRADALRELGRIAARDSKREQSASAERSTGREPMLGEWDRLAA